VADVSYYPGDICDSRGNPSLGGGRVNHTLAHALVHTLISYLAWCPECGDDLLLLTRQGCGSWVVDYIGKPAAVAVIEVFGY